MCADENLWTPPEGEPLGQRTNSIRWLQKQIIRKAAQLPHDFASRAEWEAFRAKLRAELPRIIGVPELPPLRESLVRGTARVGEDAICERVDVYMDEDYAIPSFVFRPLQPPAGRMPALVWNPGWPQSKWSRSYHQFACQMARKGFVVLILDHAPFGEAAPYEYQGVNQTRMTLVMGMGHLLGISQLALRACETMRAGEYLRARPDVNPERVAVGGLCQGGQDTWLSAALDDRFCAAAPVCAETTFAVHMGEMANYMANGDSSPFPFGILNLCDVEHLHAAIAPRPLLVRSNLLDEWWPLSGFYRVETFTRKIYKLYGAEDRMDFRFEVHEHDLTGPFVTALERFLLKYVA